MAELDDRDTLNDGGQAGRDGTDRSGQTELSRPDHNDISHAIACLLTSSDPELRAAAARLAELYDDNGR